MGEDELSIGVTVTILGPTPSAARVIEVSGNRRKCQLADGRSVWVPLERLTLGANPSLLPAATSLPPVRELPEERRLLTPAVIAGAAVAALGLAAWGFASGVAPTATGSALDTSETPALDETAQSDEQP